MLDPPANKMVRYHPVIPFKHKNKIIEHIAKSITKTDADGYYPLQSKISSCSEEIERYDLYNNNCEHVVNKCVLGLNFSELAEKKLNRCTPEIDISEKSEKVKETNREFDSKYNYKGNISEIRGYGERALDVNRDGYNMYETCIEVQPSKYMFKEMYQKLLNRQ